MSVLITKRKDLQAKAEELKALSEKADMSTEDIAKVKDLTGVCKTLKDEIEALAGAEAFNAEMKDATGVNVELDEAAGKEKGQVTRSKEGESHKTTLEFDEAAFTEKQIKALKNPDYAKAFTRYLRSKGDMDALDSMDRKALNEGIDSEGGYLTPVQTLNRILQRKAAPTRIAGRVETINAAGKSLTMSYIRNTDSDNDVYPTGIRATCTGEVPASSTVHRATTPTIAQRTVTINTWMLSLAMSNDMLEDAGVDVEAWVASKFVETIDLLKDNQILNGLGDGRGCMGILTNIDGTEGVVSVNSTVDNSFAAIDLIGMPFDVAEQYDENSVYVMNKKSTGKTIAQMLDSSNRPLWQRGGQNFPGITEKAPDILNGEPVVYSAFMPNKGNAAYPVLYGDLGGYLLAQRAALSIRLITEKYAEENATGILGRIRFGGDLLEPWRMTALKCI